MSQQNATIGRPGEWDDFVARNLFLLHNELLHKAAAIAYQRALEAPSALDKIVFFSGAVCFQHFEEIVALAGNGYGLGALVIVRSMFEKHVTACYLNQHPESKTVDAFIEFGHIQDYRLAKQVHDAVGPEAFPPGIDIEKMKAERDRVQPQFMRKCTSAKGCDKQVPMYSWSSVDMVAMAKSVGLEKQIWSCYYVPLGQAHPTIQAFAARTHEVEGKIVYDSGPQRDWADAALSAGVVLLLHSFELQREHFGLDELKPLVDKYFDAFKEAMTKRPDPPTSPKAPGNPPEEP